MKKKYVDKINTRLLELGSHSGTKLRTLIDIVGNYFVHALISKTC